MDREAQKPRRQRHTLRLSTAHEIERTLSHALFSQKLVWVLCVRSWSELDDLSTVAVDDCFHRNAPGEDSIIGRHTHFQHFPDDGAVAECAAQQVFRYLERLGHQRRLISCDQETALRSLVSEVARMRGGAVTPPEHSAVGGSQGHGFTECAGEDCRGDGQDGQHFTEIEPHPESHPMAGGTLS